MTTLAATAEMRSRWGTGKIGLVKGLRAVKVTAKPFRRKAAARPVQRPKQSSPSLVTALLPGLVGLPELRLGMPREEIDAIHRLETDVIIADLRGRFPVVFCDPPVPFAIGIDAPLRAATKTFIPKTKLERAIRWWVEQPAYLEALAAGQQRRNLDGSASGHVAAKHIALAREQLGLPPARPVLLSHEERVRLKARRARLVAP